MAKPQAQPVRIKLNNRNMDSKACQPGKTDKFVWDTELRGFGLRIKPSGVKSFILQYRNRLGESRRMTLGVYSQGLTPSQARDEALKHKAAAKRGRDPAKEIRASRDAATFDMVADDFIADYARPKKKARSVEEDERNLKLHLRPRFGARKMASITQIDVARLHASMKEMPFAANRCLSLLSKICSWCETRGDRPRNSNPCSGISRFPEPGRERFLNGEEMRRLGDALAAAEHAKTEPQAYIDAIRLLIFTGARRSEIVNLRWRDVDFEGAALRLPDSKTGRKQIRLPAPALSVLASIGQGKADDLVLWTRKGKPITGLGHAWIRLRKAAELEDVRIHDLRHSFASVAAGMGESMGMLRRLLGHSQIQTTQRYSHLERDAVLGAADRVGAAIDGMMRGAAGAAVVELKK